MTAIETAVAARAPHLPAQAVKIMAREVNVHYGTKHALIDVSVDIPEKAVTAFIGPSAAASRRSCAASTG